MSGNHSTHVPAVRVPLRQALDKFLIGGFVMSKLAVVFVLLAAFVIIPSRANLWNRYYTGGERGALYIPFCNWDGQHYLLLADQGYASPAAKYSVTLHPLFPLSIALTKTVLLNLYLSAFVNVAIFSFLFLWVFYAYARRFIPVDRAQFAVALVLLYPASLFLTVFYSESLFLLCFFAFLYCYDAKHWGAVVFAALLPLVRAQGLFVACAFILYLAWRIWRRGRPNASYELKILAGFTAGTALYFLFFKLITGDFLTGLRAQKYFVAESNVLHILNVPQFIRYLVRPSASWFAYNDGLVDKILVLLMLAGIPVMMRAKIPLHVFLYVILVYFPAAMGVGAMSFARYSLLAVPFLILALLQLCTSRKACVILFACAGTAFLVVQIVFVSRFALNLWVG